MPKRSRRIIEFGDFQTPLELARDICSVLCRSEIRPASVLEPTCGTGAFVQAALETFPTLQVAIGYDVNNVYVQQARQRVSSLDVKGVNVSIRQGNFFEIDWTQVLAELPDPILIVGNPPWVTNAKLGSIGETSNVPQKANVDQLRGIEAITGRSNFDISEWMLRQNLQWLAPRSGTLAVLCKTTVARKVLKYAWKENLGIQEAKIFRVDALRYFGAAVDACLLVIRLHPSSTATECHVFPALESKHPEAVWGWRGRRVVSNTHAYDRWKHLISDEFQGWRSGIKHDAANVLELVQINGRFVNGFGIEVDVEESVVFPLLKGSDLISQSAPHRWLIVPQKAVGEDTHRLQQHFPKTWQYLLQYASLLDRRKSAVYRGRPRFAIFGVGAYSFAPWKVGIAGFSKQLQFVPIAPVDRKPVVLDDTSYFFPCASQEESTVLLRLLHSPPAQELFSALIFWDAKRPITANVLNSLDLLAVAREVGNELDSIHLLLRRARSKSHSFQLPLFDVVNRTAQQED